MFKNFIKTCILSVGAFVFKSKRSIMIYYHDIHKDKKYTSMSTDIKLIKKHIEIIKKEGFELVNHITKENYQIQIGFDDGYRGIYENRYFFIENGIFPTIFVATSLIGKPNFLSEAELIELHNLGFNIQSHGIRHKPMINLRKMELIDDLTRSKIKLENILNKKIDGICFPMGKYSSHVINESRKAGYSNLYTSIPIIQNDDIDIKPRLLFQSLTPLQAKFALRGGLNIIQKHYKNLHFK